MKYALKWKPTEQYVSGMIRPGTPAPFKYTHQLEEAEIFGTIQQALAFLQDAVRGQPGWNSGLTLVGVRERVVEITTLEEVEL